MKILVGTIGYITCKEHFYFLQKTMESIKNQYCPGIEIINMIYYNKYNEEKLFNIYSNIKEINEDKPFSVSACWNKIIQEGFKQNAEYILVCNSDIIMNIFCVKNLVNFAESHSKFIFWTASEYDNEFTINESNIVSDTFDEHPHFSCFMLNKKTIDKIGYFDEKFYPAYFEDQDYHNRILIAGEKAGKTGMAKFYHYGSRTIKCDEELNKRNFITYEKNRKYFLEKWGYDGHGRGYTNEERIKLSFKKPFNKEI